MPRGVQRVFLPLLLTILGQSFTGSAQTVEIVGTVQTSPGSSLLDSGTVTVTANSSSKTVNYNQYSTASSLASAVAAKFSQDSCSPVWAQASGNVIVFKPRASGSNITLSTSSTYDSSDFARNSFFLDSAFYTSPLAVELTVAMAMATWVSS